MSPEQAGGLRLDRRTDVFSIGIVLYLATVGQHPFRREGESRDEQLLRLLTGSIPAPSRIDPDYPPELERIVMRALQRRPEKRYASAAEMRRELLEWLVSTGPPVTEQDVAAMMHERVGTRMEERAQRIRRRLGLPSCADDENTFMPSTAPSRPRPVPRTQKGLALTAVLGAVAVAIMLGASISKPRSFAAATHSAVQPPSADPPALSKQKSGSAPTVTPRGANVAVVDAAAGEPENPQQHSQTECSQGVRDAGATTEKKDSGDDNVRAPVLKRPPSRRASSSARPPKAQLPCKRWGI